MIPLYRKILDNRTLSSGEELDLTGAFDLSGYRELHLVLTVVTAGEGDDAKLVVRHAPTNDESAYRDFPTPAEIALNTTGSAWFVVSSFTWFVHWFVSGTLNADAVVTLELIGKP